jgi:hypothetical protein
MTQAIGMIGALDLPDAAGAGGQRRVLGIPTPHVGADARDPAVGHVRVDHATAAAIMPACAGDYGFARDWTGARSLVDRVHARVPAIGAKLTSEALWHRLFIVMAGLDPAIRIDIMLHEMTGSSPVMTRKRGS